MTSRPMRSCGTAAPDPESRAAASSSATAASRGSSTFTTATRARSKISDLARTMASIDPMRSRCTGPTAVSTAISGGSQLAQRADLAFGVHAHLGDEDLGAGLEVLVDRRARPSRLLKLAGLRDDDVAVAEQVADVLLRRRLAVRARDGDDARSHLLELGACVVDVPVAEPGLDRCEGCAREVDHEGEERARSAAAAHAAATRRARGRPPARPAARTPTMPSVRSRRVSASGEVRPRIGQPERPQHDRDRAHEQHGAPARHPRSRLRAAGGRARRWPGPARNQRSQKRVTLAGQVVLALLRRAATAGRRTRRRTRAGRSTWRGSTRSRRASSARHADAIASGCVNGRSCPASAITSSSACGAMASRRLGDRDRHDGVVRTPHQRGRALQPAQLVVVGLRDAPSRARCA